jgi:hypothetical protein
MRSARSDVRDHIVLPKADQWTFVSAQSGVAAAESRKHRLLRDFQRCLILDFCNSIGQQRTSCSSPFVL